MSNATATDRQIRLDPEHFSLLAVGSCVLTLAAWLFDPNPLAVVGAAAIPLALLMCTRRPIIICTLFMTITFFRIHEAYPFLEQLKLPLIFGVLLIATLLIQWLVMGRIVPVWTKELKILILLVTLVAAGILFAKNRQLSWNFFSDVYWKIVIVSFAVAWITRSADDFNKVSRILILSGIAIAAVAIYNKINSIGLVEGTRVTIARKAADEQLINEIDPLEYFSTLSDPNDLALILLFPLAFAMSSLVYRSGPVNILIGIFGSVTTTLAIIFTQSRGGLLGVLAVLGVLGFRVIKSRAVVITLSVVAALGLATAMGLSARVSGGAQEISESGIDDSSLGRLIAWRAAIAMAAARPLNGVGVNGFIDAYHFFSEVPNRREKAVHSTWFQVLGETGLPGLAVFLTLVFFTFRTALRNVSRLAKLDAPPVLSAAALSLVAGMASFCVAGTFLTQAFTLPLYVLIGLTVAVSRAIDRQEAAIPLEPPVEAWQPHPPLRSILRHRPEFGRGPTVGVTPQHQDARQSKGYAFSPHQAISRQNSNHVRK